MEHIKHMSDQLALAGKNDYAKEIIEDEKFNYEFERVCMRVIGNARFYKQ